MTDDEAASTARTNLLITGATTADEDDNEDAEDEDEDEDEGAARLAPTASSSVLVDLVRFSFLGSAARRAWQPTRRNQEQTSCNAQ